MRQDYLVGCDSTLRLCIGIFLVVISIGFFTGLGFVHYTTESSPTGINAHYTGNEEDLTAETMKFRKSGYEMFNLIHTHFLGMGMLFFILAVLVYGCALPIGLKRILMFEPLLSVLLTFGSIYLVWVGCAWATYIVMVSGVLMTMSFVISILLVVRQLFR